MKRNHNTIESDYNNFSVYRGTRSRQTISEFQQLPDKKKQKIILWVSATKTYNAMMNDHLVDWLNLYGRNMLNRKDASNSKQFTDFLCKKGVDFEAALVDYLQKRFQTASISQYYSIDAVQMTINQMMAGVPIIMSAPIANKSTATFGIADMLVRSDYINHIFCPDRKVISDEDAAIKAPKLTGNYHYRVLEIKYCTIPLTSDGIHVQNIQKFVAYKGQICIYNEALGKMQGYVPSTAYLVGRKTKYFNALAKTNWVSQTAFDRPGCIDFSKKDQSIIKLVKNAVAWYRTVQRKGATWSLNPPSCKELYPNMKVESGKWNAVKETMAKRMGEITLLWNCGINNRQKALDENINSYRDVRCTGEVLGFTNHMANNINNLIKVNTTTETIVPKNIRVSAPLMYQEMSGKTKEFYVDFETFGDICQDIKTVPQHVDFNMIFMIGVGWMSNGIWHYKNFIADAPTYDAERSIMQRFENFLQKASNVGDAKSPPLTLFHWNADEYFWNQAVVRAKQYDNGYIDKTKGVVSWHNLMNIFVNYNVAIKGCCDYKLKSIASSMKKLGMVDTELQAECTNGMVAMIRAWQCYEKYQNPTTAPIMKDIEHYNQYDCKIMCDILQYFRNNIFVDAAVVKPITPATFPNNIPLCPVT